MGRWVGSPTEQGDGEERGGEVVAARDSSGDWHGVWLQLAARPQRANSQEHLRNTYYVNVYRLFSTIS